jgi:hypothetical protein
VGVLAGVGVNMGEGLGRSMFRLVGACGVVYSTIPHPESARRAITRIETGRIFVIEKFFVIVMVAVTLVKEVYNPNFVRF